jgi:pyruvate dehydrogenase E2 component (dihydrolipoamide acetyltransferase)
MSNVASSSLNLVLPAWPEVDFSQFGAVELVALSKIQVLTSRYLARNSVVIPHVTHHDEVDITDLDGLRRTMVTPQGGKVTALSFFIKALSALLREYPKFNSSLDGSGERLILKKYFHVGVAVDTPSGLLVPVIRDCDQKSVFEIADELAAISTRARDKGLPMKDMVGGCMTISSLGHIGGTGFTPIINAPEVAILGVTQARWQPVRGEDNALIWRLMQPVSLSYDHRVINGVDAARFTASMSAQLAKVAATAR